MFPLEVLLLLKVGAGPGSVGKSAVVSLLDWYDLGQEVVLVLERPVPSEDLLTYISNNDGSLDENTAKVIHLCSYGFEVAGSHQKCCFVLLLLLFFWSKLKLQTPFSYLLE